MKTGTGRGIHLDRLDEAIETYNSNRNMMATMYEMLKTDDSPLGGADVAEMALSGMLMDKAEHNELLRQALKELSQSIPVSNKGPRLMLLGSVNSEIGGHKVHRIPGWQRGGRRLLHGQEVLPIPGCSRVESTRGACDQAYGENTMPLERPAKQKASCLLLADLSKTTGWPVLSTRCRGSAIRTGLTTR